MTERSTRRRAENAIIDAAYRWNDYPGPQQARDLNLAVLNHRTLGLEQLSRRAARSNNSTETSAAAGASLGDISGLARICFDEIALAGGLTVYQLTQILGRPHQTVSARVNDLMRKNWITDSGLRRPTGSGRAAVVWKPSALAAEILP
jgi:hypothetical protein